MKKGVLYLIPTVLAEGTAEKIISTQVKEVILNTRYFLVENLRTARRYISSLKLGISIGDLDFQVLDKNSTEGQMAQLMKPLWEGHDIGVLSEAGCPGIADPGSLGVAYAHTKGIQVVPLSGPSSMFLALMASGFNGQSFAFHGYLPIDKKERATAIRELEKESLRKNRSQIFMETPFRNNQLLQDLKQHLHPDTLLCIAKNLTAKDETILTKTAQSWKKTEIDLHKIPTVFLIYASKI
ncbi:SAM-dependent methyltransferase [Pararhodonellum marinum]|uniref:SAM-dependent methyltransferase n=1 Tax=Pararhodonellum marinum TaxID=2755358 RepID=UPI00188FE3D4|nr:SAM-dependent methyltransferase [Pararhodonellum marinum]